MYHSLACSCLHQSEEQLSVPAPGAHLLLPTPVGSDFFREHVGCSKSLHALGKGRLLFTTILVVLSTPPPSCCLTRLFSVVLFTAHCQPCLCLPASPRTAGWGLFHSMLLQPRQTALLPSSIRNARLSHHWQDSSEAFPHLSNALISPPLLAVLFHCTQAPFTGLAPQPAVPTPCHPVPAFLAPSLHYCIPTDMPGLDRGAGCCLLYCTLDMFSAWCKAHSTNQKSCFDLNGFQMETLDCLHSSTEISVV